MLKRIRIGHVIKLVIKKIDDIQTRIQDVITKWLLQKIIIKFCENNIPIGWSKIFEIQIKKS